MLIGWALPSSPSSQRGLSAPRPSVLPYGALMTSGLSSLGVHTCAAISEVAQYVSFWNGGHADVRVEDGADHGVAWWPAMRTCLWLYAALE